MQLGAVMAHAQWWLSFALFGAIVLLFVIAAVAMDPLTASIP